MSRHARTLTLAAAASLALVSGCSSPPPPPAAMMFFVPAATVAGLTIISIPPTIGLPHGPTVTIVNRSDAPMNVRIWTARVDVSTPAGYSDQQTADRLAFRVEPDQLHYLDAGRDGWVTGQNDAIVWLRLEPAPPDDSGPPAEPIWVQFERPGPYKIEIGGTFDRAAANAGLRFYPLEDTTFSPLPRSLWIEHHDGIYAIAQ